MHFHCITGQLIRSHANSKMFLWHLRKVSNGLQLDACNNEDECYNRSLNISNGTKYMEIPSKYFKFYDLSYTHYTYIHLRNHYQYTIISYNMILPNMILSSTTVRERNILSRQWSMVCDQNHSFITFIRLSLYLYHFVF